jgi:ribosome-binding protein aMBF1 (putative translation factor)
MTLRELHQKLSKDAGYRKQYAKLKGIVELAMNVRGAREDRGITQQELARATGVSTFDLSRFETLTGDADPMVISKLVDYLEVPLRNRGVRVEQWIIPPENQPPGTVGLGAAGRISERERLRSTGRGTKQREPHERTTSETESQPTKE